jgi:hypothetical protein
MPDPILRARIRPRTVVLGILALPLFVVFALNLNGYCWSQGRFLTDKELIDIAIKSNLSFHAPNRPWNKMYTSPEDLRVQNPDCCSIERQENEDAELPQFLMSILGMYASTVEVTYRSSDSGPEPFYESYSIVGACGTIGRSYGTGSATDPRRR